MEYKEIKVEEVLEGNYYWIKLFKESENYVVVECKKRYNKLYFDFTNGMIREVRLSGKILEIPYPNN